MGETHLDSLSWISHQLLVMHLITSRTTLLGLLQTFFSTSNGFGVAIGSRVEVTEISAVKKVGEPQKMEGRVVCEVTVDEGIYHHVFI